MPQGVLLVDDRTILGRRGFLAGAVAGGAGLAAGVAWSPMVDAASSASGPSAADLGFCADMTAHHVQALVMCERVLGNPTGDAVQAAATEVLRNQSIEVGMMRAWLADWGASTAEPTTVMAWMGMNEGAGMPLAMMPGYASAAELQALAQADGIDQGRQWLTLMRAHHVGGVAMADAAATMASEEKVIRLATTQSAVQSFEIDQYDQLLATTYA